MKKLALPVLAVTIAFFAASCVSEKERAPKMGIVMDVGGTNDHGFNQSALEGADKAQKELDLDISYLESNTEADYEVHMETMAGDEKQLVVGVGYKMKDAVSKAAQSHTGTQFALIDYADSDGKAPENNVIHVQFKSNQVAYLVGVMAARTTTTGKIGLILGEDSSAMNESGYGFYAGVLSQLPEAVMYGRYAGAFNDPAKGKAIASQLYYEGCDVIFACAGDTNNGIIEAAQDADKWVIGADRDQSSLAPGNVLTSAVKRVDTAVYDLAGQLKNGTLNGGTTLVYGLDNGGVDIAPSSNQNVSQEVLDYVEGIKTKIISGEIVVPETKEEFNQELPGADYMESF